MSRKAIRPCGPWANSEPADWRVGLVGLVEAVQGFRCHCVFGTGISPDASALQIFLVRALVPTMAEERAT